MTIRKILVCLSALFLSSTMVLAQGGRLADEADDAFTKGFYFNAIELYKKAYTVEKKAPVKAELIFKVAESYRMIGDVAQAQVWYEKANKAQYTDPITYYWIGQMQKQQGLYAEAIASYNKYKEKKSNDPRADAGIAACQMAQKWKDSPTRYSVDPEVLLNTPQYDYSPAFSDKKNESVVFSSTRPAASGSSTDLIIGEAFADLFASSRDRLGKWSEPVKLPIEINSEGNEATPIFNAKRTLMYFTRCPAEKKKVFGCDIWVSKKVGNNFAAPVMLKLKLATVKEDTLTAGHPALSADDDMLVFATNSPYPGHKGGKDLYMVKLDREGMPAGTPVNLGAEVNTAKDDMFPFLRYDGSFYYSSNGMQGMGGMDIYHAEKTGEGTWGHVENMKSPLNSASDDLGITFDGENDRGFFTTNRPGGKGQHDIWRFYMPDLEFALQGNVYDKVSGQPIVGAKITAVGTNGSNFSALTDDNGGFAFIENGKDRYIKEETSYSILVEKEGYLVVKDQITTVGLTESTTFVKEYFLQPHNRVIVLPRIEYDVDQFFLRPESKDSLETLYQTLVDNPNIVIELRSHTDARPTRKYKGGNLELSQKRAQSCVNYLVEKGIDPARMVAVGRGPDEPMVTMDVIKKMATNEEKEAAHQQNRRTDFKVLRTDFVPGTGSTPPPPAPNN
ncbi:MAG: OmpA family protein [Flavobacteriales bacterium]|nr:OmpA family protein [Flavobacteriales bacterium]